MDEARSMLDEEVDESDDLVPICLCWVKLCFLCMVVNVVWSHGRWKKMWWADTNE